MTGDPITYATRRSTLALAQCRALVGDLRAKLGAGLPPWQELLVVTSGDRIQDRPLSDVGGKGLFVKEIEEALLDGRADFAVHSMKDLPAVLAPGLVVGCVAIREDARDVLIAPRHRSLDALPSGAKIGTSSLRRLVTLKRLRPDLRVEPLRGNVDTRLRKVDGGEWDAVVLARAGLARLGLAMRATEVLSPDVSLPAPGQGALAVECRRADTRIQALLATIHDPDSAACVAAERGVLEALGADCKTPLGAYAERTGDRLRLRAFVARPDGADFRALERTAPWPSSEGEARELGLAAGGELRDGHG